MNTGVSTRGHAGGSGLLPGAETSRQKELSFGGKPAARGAVLSRARGVPLRRLVSQVLFEAVRVGLSTRTAT